MVVDLSKLIKKLKVQKVILVGHSMGGKVAMYFTLKEPFKVEKLVVEDISPVPESAMLDLLMYDYLEQLKEALTELPSDVQNLDDAKNFVANYVLQRAPQYERSDRHSIYDKSIWPLERNDDGEFQWKTNLESMENALLCGPDNATLSDGLYEGPVLFLYGKKSPTHVLEDKDFILARFPKAVFKGIEGATHQLHLEYRDEFLKEIIPFLNEK